MSETDLSAARAHWRLDQHDTSLAAGAKAFEERRRADERNGWKFAGALLACAASLGAILWNASQGYEQAQATGRGLAEARTEISELRREVSQQGRSLDRALQALDYLTERTKAQDAELQRLRDKAKR